MKGINIYGTLGPSCYKKETIKKMFELGMTGMRLNLSHVDLKDCNEWISNFHEAARSCDINPELLIDMKGPELRIKRNLNPVLLTENDLVDISDLGFPEIVKPYLNNGQEILLDDGKILLKMMNTTKALVVHPGLLKPSKSIALPNCNIDTPTLTETDLENLKVASEFGITGVMQPFVRNADDLKYVRQKLDENNLSECKLYAKIENKSGVSQLEELIPFCDEIIIARGDLGNAVGLDKLPSVQRSIEKTCKQNHIPYMVVTEMLHSMISNPTPTRAEVSDIYHAVLQGASSIMLTAETAAGKYPIDAMRYFINTAGSALQDREDSDKID